MFYAKFDKNGYISEFVEKETSGYTEIANLNCKLINGVIVDETDKVKQQEKLKVLENWFDNYFDKQLNQSLWQDDFTVSHDDYFNKDYANIDELKAQAKIVRNEIRELRKWN